MTADLFARMSTNKTRLEGYMNAGKFCKRSTCVQPLENDMFILLTIQDLSAKDILSIDEGGNGMT